MAPVALLGLLIIVLSGGPDRSYIPWLPLYVVVACLMTAAMYEPFKVTPDQYAALSHVYGDSNFASPSANHRSSGPSSEFSEPRAPSQSYRIDPNNFQHMGPGSSRSAQTSSGATEYSLGDLEGAARDPQAAFIFGNAHSEIGRAHV